MRIKLIDTAEENDRDYKMMNGGINSKPFQVMKVLGLNFFSIQCFRDTGYDKRRKRVWILARTGSNSLYPERNNRELEQNEHFLKRYDEPTDASYELLIFNLPLGAKLRHVPLPNFALILKKAEERMEQDNLILMEGNYDPSESKTR